MRVSAKQVSWRTWNEWTICFRDVNSMDTTRLRAAAKTIRKWMSRGKVPVSVETTGLLIEAIALDRGTQSDSNSTVSAEMTEFVTVMFCTALTRFVNLMTDISQRGQTAASVEVIADTLKIPGWIVQLRHSFVHGATLPSIDAARKAGMFILHKILLPRYWLNQYSLISNVNDLQPIVSESGQGMCTVTNHDDHNLTGKSSDMLDVEIDFVDVHRVASVGKNPSSLVRSRVGDDAMAQVFTDYDNTDGLQSILKLKQGRSIVYRTILKKAQSTSGRLASSMIRLDALRCPAQSPPANYSAKTSMTGCTLGSRLHI